MLAQCACAKPDHLFFAVDNFGPLSLYCTYDNQMDRIRSDIYGCESHELSAFLLVFNANKTSCGYLFPNLAVVVLMLKSSQPLSFVFLQRLRSISSAFNRACSAFRLFGSDAKAMSVR